MRSLLQLKRRFNDLEDILMVTLQDTLLSVFAYIGCHR